MRNAESRHTEVSRFGTAASDSKVGSVQNLVGLTVIDGRVKSVLSLIEIEKLSIGKGGKIVEIKVVRLLRPDVLFRRDCVEIGEVVGDIGCLATDVARHGRGYVRPRLDIDVAIRVVDGVFYINVVAARGVLDHRLWRGSRACRKPWVGVD